MDEVERDERHRPEEHDRAHDHDRGEPQERRPVVGAGDPRHALRAPRRPIEHAPQPGEEQARHEQGGDDEEDRPLESGEQQERCRHEGPQGEAGVPAEGEHAHRPVAVARRDPRRPGRLRVERGDPETADRDEHPGRPVLDRERDEAHPESGREHPGRDEPAARPAIAPPPEGRLRDRGEQVGREDQAGDRRIAVVALHHEERQEGRDDPLVEVVDDMGGGHHGDAAAVHSGDDDPAVSVSIVSVSMISAPA